MSTRQARKWWKEANCYQIWPASFQDSNDDGVGDIPGIVMRLDYLRDLGVDLIWLSPVYDSPQFDMGYDIANYEDIWTKYGTLADMDRLIKEAKARNIKIIMDLVVNHTSSEHKWFKESSKSKDESNEYRDWYHWRDPKGFDADGRPIEPNNWQAAFGGSVWAWCEARQQFYLHLCLPEQPDLNWFNPVTRRAIFDSAIEFWLKRGIDGFRVDVVNVYWKDTTFPDAPISNPKQKWQNMLPEHILNGPLVHSWLQEQRREAIAKYGENVILVGELPATSPEQIMRYLDPKYRELDMIFDFDLFMVGGTFTFTLHENPKRELHDLKKALKKTQSFLESPEGWTTTFLENHDNSRSIDRFGPGMDSKYRAEAARMLALLCCSMSGTLFLYQGQEFGMANLPRSWSRSDFRDKATLNYLNQIETEHPNDKEMEQMAHDAALRLGRDNARTPVQWSAAPYAGFSNVQPWINVNPNYTDINVEAQFGKREGVLEFWRLLLASRKEHRDTWIYGHTDFLDYENKDKMSYTKTCPDTGAKVLVELNFSEKEQRLIEFEKLSNKSSSLVLTSHIGGNVEGHEKSLRPWEGRVYSFE